MSMEFRKRNIEKTNKINDLDYYSYSKEQIDDIINKNTDLLNDAFKIQQGEKNENFFQDVKQKNIQSNPFENDLNDEFKTTYLFTSQEEYRQQFIAFAQELKNKYGDKFILMLDKTEEEKYIDLYSKGYRRPKLEVIKDYKEYLEKEKENLPKPDLIFYHGGASSDFNIDSLDVTKPSEKQQNSSNSYAGFYMYDESNKTAAYDYAVQENNRKNRNDLGVVKISINPDLKIYDYNEHHSDMFGITRISQDMIKQLQEQGYDIIKGKVLSKTEYVLLNKNKITNLDFIPIDYKLENENSEFVR